MTLNLPMTSSYIQESILGLLTTSKGKSTIFKIIKFALTGVESYKHDIKKWLHEIHS